MRPLHPGNMYTQCYVWYLFRKQHHLIRLSPSQFLCMAQNRTVDYIYVVYNGAKSERKIVTCGVPQGSILGPLFFLAYMNAIFNVSDFLYNILYADDTCLYLAGSDLCALINLINAESKLILHWLKANRLTLNWQGKKKMSWQHRSIH